MYLRLVIFRKLLSVPFNLGDCLVKDNKRLHKNANYNLEQFFRINSLEFMSKLKNMKPLEFYRTQYCLIVVHRHLDAEN